MSEAKELCDRLTATLDRVVVGMDELKRGLAVALVARGHVLVEGAPGLGKTLLAKTFARALGGSFQRIQGTADLMPADITGQNVYAGAAQGFVFRPGPVFADVLLADEINRAGPKTQSALLEAMAERHVTIDRERRALPDGFVVVATQNPQDFEGTYPLPESQLDRFMLCLRVGHPGRDEEREILARYGARLADGDAAVAGVEAVPPGLVAAARAAAERVHVAPELADYALDVARATREHPAVALGVSTRGALMLLRAARVAAALRGGEYAVPDDVRALVPPLLGHRVLVTPEAALEERTALAVLDDVLARVPVPR